MLPGLEGEVMDVGVPVHHLDHQAVAGGDLDDGGVVAHAPRLDMDRRRPARTGDPR